MLNEAEKAAVDDALAEMKLVVNAHDHVGALSAFQIGLGVIESSKETAGFEQVCDLIQATINSIYNAIHLPTESVIQYNFINMPHPEVIQRLKLQHNHHLRELAYFQLTEDPEMPPPPSFAEIQARLEADPSIIKRACKFQKPTLLLTPIGMDPQKMLELIAMHPGRMPFEKIPKLGESIQIASPGINQYDSYKLSKGNIMSMQAYLELRGDWSAIIVDGRRQINGQQYADSTNSPFDTYWAATKDQELHPMTVEEELMFHAHRIINTDKSEDMPNSEATALCLGSVGNNDACPGLRWTQNMKYLTIGRYHLSSFYTTNALPRPAVRII